MTASSDVFRGHGLKIVSGVIANISALVMQLILFRIGSTRYGIELVGVWALAMAFVALARVFEAGSIINIPLLISSRSQAGRPVVFWHIMTASACVSVVPTIVLVFPISVLTLAFFEYSVTLETAVSEKTIISLVLCCGIAGASASLASYVQAVMEGFGGLGAKNLSLTVGHLITILVAYLTRADYGIIILPLAMTAGFLFQAAISGSLLLRRQLATQTQGVGSLRDLFSYFMRTNATLLGIALSRLTFEPLSKALMAAFGGVALVAFFDVAVRISTFARTSLQQFIHPMLTQTARTELKLDRASEHFRYNDLAQRFLVAGLALGCGMIALSGFVSFAAFASISREYLIIQALLAISVFLNVQGITAFYIFASASKYLELFYVHLMMAAVTGVGGYCLGSLFAGIGVALSYAIAFSLGGLTLMMLASTFTDVRPRLAELPLSQVAVMGVMITLTGLSLVLLTLEVSSTAGLALGVCGAIAAGGVGLLSLIGLLQQRPRVIR